MQHSTAEPYQMKQEILHFTGKISAGTDRDWQKFTADMMYSIEIKTTFASKPGM